MACYMQNLNKILVFLKVILLIILPVVGFFLVDWFGFFSTSNTVAWLPSVIHYGCGSGVAVSCPSLFRS